MRFGLQGAGIDSLDQSWVTRASGLEMANARFCCPQAKGAPVFDAFARLVGDVGQASPGRSRSSLTWRKRSSNSWLRREFISVTARVAGTRKWPPTFTLAEPDPLDRRSRDRARVVARTQKYLAQVASGGSLILFVGTKRQAGAAIEREASRCNMPFVSERWLGGALTNFRTVRSRLTRLEELEKIRGGEELQAYSKKMQSSLNREYRKMYRNLNGLRSMNRLPECLVVIDPNKERNAVREAHKLGIATVALIDTDCDPDSVDLPIPGNDDGIRSIELVAKILADAVIAGRQEASVQAKDADAAPEGQPANA